MGLTHWATYIEINRLLNMTLTLSVFYILQVAEMEKELEPMKEKLRSDKHSTEKYDEKVDEWKVLYHFGKIKREKPNDSLYL